MENRSTNNTTTRTYREGEPRKTYSRTEGSNYEHGSGSRNNNKISRLFKKKKCPFCIGKIKHIDLKKVDTLKDFTTERGKILPHKITGNCVRHQRRVAHYIKLARYLALMPYIRR